MRHSARHQPAAEVRQQVNVEPLNAVPLPTAVDNARRRQGLEAVEAHNSRRNTKRCGLRLPARHNQKITARRTACRRVCRES
jgi:hypothetical protein